MNRLGLFLILSVFLIFTTSLLATDAIAADVADDIATIRSAATAHGVSDDAQRAWRRLATLDANKLPTLLASMKGADPLATNWLRTAIDAVAEHQLQAGGELPIAALEKFVNDTNQAPRARRTAFEWLTQVDPAAKPRLLAAMLDDPSMSLRYDAVQHLLKNAQLTQTADSQREKYLMAWEHARNLQQLETIAEELKKLDQEVDLVTVLGFVMNWQIIGPFDNTGLAHFDTAYPPESEQSLARQYGGKRGEISWQPATAGNKEGFVDFIATLGKEKEAVAYAFAKFMAEAGEAEIRYQSKNATKVWLNGQLVASNEVYHSGGDFDQYRVPVTLQPGENTVLVKSCQNEQRMPWEQEWHVRLRVVDGVGTPVATQPSAATDAPPASPLRR